MNKLIIISDVDGVLTDGSFYYTESGKYIKKFGRDDADAIKILKQQLPNTIIKFCTSDLNGFNISKKRITDMNCELEYIPVKSRPDWIKTFKSDGSSYVVYIGDSFVDIPIYSIVDFSCCVNNGHYLAKNTASYVSNMNGGDGGFADCILEVLSNFIKKTKIEILNEYICN